MAESARSKLKVVIGADADGAKTALIDLSNAFRDVRNSAREGFALPNLKLIETQVKAGLRPLQDLKRALAETIGQAKLADRINADPINKQRIAEAVIELKRLNSELKQTDIQAEQTGQKLRSMGGLIKDALLPLAGLAAGMAFALQGAGTAGQTFATQLRLISTISKQSSSDLQVLGDDILRASNLLQTDAVDLAAANYEILSSGITNSSDAFEVMTESAKLAKAGIATAAESADILTSSINALGGTPARNAEILFKTVELGKVKISELAESFGGVASQAAVAGVSLEEISASVATLSLTGQNANEGLTGIRSILTAVAKQGPESVKFAKQIGLEFNTAAIRAKGFAGFIADVADKTKGSDEAIAKLFGRVEAINSILSLGTTQADVYAENLDKIKNSAGALDEAYQRMLNPINGVINAFKNLSIAVGTELTTALEEPADALKNFFEILQNNKGLLTFATGAATAAAAVLSLGAAVSGLFFVFGPLLPLLQGLAAAMAGGAAAGAVAGGVALGPAILAVAAAIGVLVLAGGLFATVAKEMKESADIAKRSVADLKNEIENVAAAKVASSKKGQDLAKSLNALAVKTNKTTDEKKKLKDGFIELQKQFPGLEGSIDSLIAKYGDLNTAVLSLRVNETALALGKEIDSKIEQLDKEIFAKENFAKRKTNLFTTVSPEERAAEKKTLDNLRAQRAAAVEERENLSTRLIAMFKKEDAASDKKDPNDKGTKPGGVDPAEAEKIIAARQQLKQKLAQIDVEITGFTQGEFAKRRADAERSYQDEVANIQKLGKEGQLTQAEITQGITKAGELRDRRLAQLAKEQSQAVKEAQFFVKELQTNVEALNAAITLSNPFDDITTDAKRASAAITREYNVAVKSLQDAVAKNPQLASVASETKEFLQKQYQSAMQLQRTFEQQRKFEAGRALLDLQQQNRQLVTEAAGDTLAIEKANNARILADLELRIENQKKILEAAGAALSLNPDNQDLGFGKQQAQAELENLQAQALKQNQESVKKQTEIETQGIQTVIDALEQKVALEGRSPELIQKLIVAYDLLLDQLEKEKNLTSQSAENRAQIQATIEESRFAQAGLKAETNTFGKALTALSRVDFGGNFGNAFSGIISGLQGVNSAFEAFKGKPENAGKGFLNFFKSAEGASSRQFGLQAGSQAVQLISQQLGKGKSKLGQALGGALSGALAGASFGSAILPGIGTAVGAIGGALIGGASASTGGKFSGKDALKGFLYGGGIGFLIGGFAGAAKRKKELERQQKIADGLVKKALEGADSNNINDLQSRLSALLRNNKGLTGSRVKQISEASNQLRAAITERRKVISEAVRDLNFQNQALDLALKQFDDQPIENLNIDRQIELGQLEEETRKALENFKDSAEVLDLIQRNAELKRQALLRSSAQSIVDTIIAEQNQIRDLRAAAAVSDAEAAGDSIALINARLQAELVRLDNEVAAFKGAEETKTEFLKATSAERERIIKASQKQIDDVLRGGLEILNEGLVTSETKFDSQSRRLKELLGSNLNIGGLIQSNGSLLQRDITIGSGGIQFILQGVTDAPSLIEQIKDPLVQAKLLEALNAAIARN